MEVTDLGLGRFDLITMTHVLEHLREPVRGLVWIRRHLAPGGLAVIEVPTGAISCDRCGAAASARSSSAITSASSSAPPSPPPSRALAWSRRSCGAPRRSAPRSRRVCSLLPTSPSSSDASSDPAAPPRPSLASPAIASGPPNRAGVGSASPDPWSSAASTASTAPSAPGSKACSGPTAPGVQTSWSSPGPTRPEKHAPISPSSPGLCRPRFRVLGPSDHA
ncbi:class I SAM-dependent methyltransferase [Nannocystis pusilla]|uniref:class I SAM-dependent methyltransferase n=1 Tax=Nannocystis pusilla TaxID=889268 RepID=UPI003B778830